MLYASTPAPPPLPQPRAPSIAPWAHTIILVAFFAITGALGHMRAMVAAQTMPHLLRYASLITYEWLLLGSVIAGILHRRAFFRTALGQRVRSNGECAAIGAAVYAAGFVLILAIAVALQFTPLGHMRNTEVVAAMMPQTPIEFLLWLGASATAGICEEIIFRGYLLQQITAWTQRPLAAVLITGILFGCIHLYEGAAAILPLAALGSLFGIVVVRMKGDLRAVIVAHFLQDFLTAFLALARPVVERHAPHS